MTRDPSANQKLSKDVAKRHRLSVSNIRLPWLIFTLIIFSGLLTLGFWQIDRAIEKEQRLARINQLSQHDWLRRKAGSEYSKNQLSFDFR